MTIGKRIEKIRKDNNLSQQEFGQRLGVSRQSVSRWEMDASIPDIDKLMNISKQYDVSIDYLLDTKVKTVKTDDKRSKWPLVLLVCVFCLIIICIYSMFLRINNLENSINRYYNNSYYVNYDGQIETLKNEIVESIVRANSMILNSNIENIGFNDEGLMQSKVEIIPKYLND